MAYASNLSSPNFRIDMGTINITGGQKTSSISKPIKLNSTVGQSFQGQSKTDKQLLTTGFQYTNFPAAFSFTIDKSSLHFDNLLPNTFYTDTNVLTVNATNLHGYSVKIIEDHPPQDDTKTAIPNTACDSITPCSVTNATPWTSDKANGFGYSLDGINYRPLPDNSANQSPVDIMNHPGLANGTHTATITYKINRPSSQKNGVYQNTVQYIALPSF